MNLIKDEWKIEDKQKFLNHIMKFKREESKCKWEKNIINTNYTCLGILAPHLKNIANDITKGNPISFLELQIYDNFPAITVMGHIICSIKNFDTMKHYLDLYSLKVDNWSNCDQLKFKVTKDNKTQFLYLAKEYIKSPLTFRRRIALIIMFNFINEHDIQAVFNIANSLYNEKEYYVNMANGWLLCECFIKQRGQTLALLNNHQINDFTLNKMISKCHDSLRISNEDKLYLKTFKKL